MKVLISDKISDEGVEFLRQQSNIVVVNAPSMSVDELTKEIVDAHGLIVRSKTKVTPEVIEAARQLRVIGRAGAGVDNIDLDAATRRGIVVMNTPGGNSTSAAEHTLALLLALARKIPFAHESLRDGDWNKSAYVGTEVQGKILGVLGLGRIGSVLARRAMGFEMRVLAYDPFVSEAYAADLGVELTSLDQIIESSDFISLHLPLNDKTRYLIRQETIDQMKDGVLLVNAARGGLINEEDLVRALNSGKVGGAALDVFENEPNISEQLRKTPNVILTPHIAGSTLEAQAKVGYDIARQIVNYLKHDVIVNAVNFPSLSPQELAQLSQFVQLGEKLGSFIGQVSQIRISEIGIRYYGDLTRINHKPLSNYIIKAILQPILSEEINQINARSFARERGISVIETVSSRERSYSNLISIQLRSKNDTEWVEGAILRQGNLRLVSLDGIPVETQLGKTMLVMRNDDRPGVIGKVGSILGQANVNIASFVLGRTDDAPHAVGIVNTDSDIEPSVLDEIRHTPAIQFAQVVHLGD